MTLKKCQECGKDSSDTAGSCTYGGHLGNIFIKKYKSISGLSKERKIKVIIFGSFLFILALMLIKCKEKNDNPDIIGGIRLNMSQKKVEKILNQTIGSDLYYSKNNYYTDGDEICIFDEDVHKLDKNKEFVGDIRFCFDKYHKLQEVNIIIFDDIITTFKAVDNWGLGLKYSQMSPYYPNFNSVRFYYGIVGKTWVEFSDTLDGVDKGIELIYYKRVKDVIKDREG